MARLPGPRLHARLLEDGSLQVALFDGACWAASVDEREAGIAGRDNRREDWREPTDEERDQIEQAAFGPHPTEKSMDKAPADAGMKLEARIAADGSLQVCRHIDGRPAEDWREPVSVAEISTLLPIFTGLAVSDSLADNASTRAMIEQVTSLITNAIAGDKAGERAVAADAPVFGNFEVPAVRDFDDADINGALDSDLQALRSAQDSDARKAAATGAQHIPLLRVGGFVVSQHDLTRLSGRQLLLRFSTNTGLPEVATFAQSIVEGTWRAPTVSECQLFHPSLTPETLATDMIALYRKESDDDVRFIGFVEGVGLHDIRGMRERIPLGFYDTLCSDKYPLAKQPPRTDVCAPQGESDRCEYRLFDAAHIGTSMTDMQQGACFGSDQTAVISALRVEVRLASGFIGEARKAALALVRSGMDLSLTIGCKPFPPAPPDLVEGAADNAATYRYAIGGKQGIHVCARQSFHVTVALNAAAREILSIPGAHVRVWLEGMLTRDVQ